MKNEETQALCFVQPIILSAFKPAQGLFRMFPIRSCQNDQCPGTIRHQFVACILVTIPVLGSKQLVLMIVRWPFPRAQSIGAPGHHIQSCVLSEMANLPFAALDEYKNELHDTWQFTHQPTRRGTTRCFDSSPYSLRIRRPKSNMGYTCQGM